MKTIKPLIASAAVLVIIGIYFIRHHAKATSKFDSTLKFIQQELSNHKTVYKKLVDDQGEFVDFSPYDYNTLYEARGVLDSLKNIYGLVKIEEEDAWKISDEQLKNHINSSIETWKNSKFTSHVSFTDFSNYLLAK